MAVFNNSQWRNKMTIWNATQHLATPDQVTVGIVDVPQPLRARMARAMTFAELPSATVMRLSAQEIVNYLREAGAKPGDRVMVGGAPYMIPHLLSELDSVGLRPVFAFTRRESEEVAQPDGSVRKVSVFRHLGFVSA